MRISGAIAILMALGLLSVPVSRAEEQAMLVRLTAKDGVHVQGQAIALHVEFQNPSGRLLETPWPPRLGYSCHIFYRREGGNFVEYVNRWMYASGGYAIPRVVPKGATASVTVRPLYNSGSGEFVLSEPGIYEFQATLKVSIGRGETSLQSNLLSVMVVAAQGRNRAAFDYLKANPEIARFVEGDWIDDTDTIHLVDDGHGGVTSADRIGPRALQLVEFLGAFGDTAYRPEVQGQLVEMLSLGQELSPRLRAVHDALTKAKKLEPNQPEWNPRQAVVYDTIPVKP
jgi:hypothetical protein